jgi:hypothetical protein
VFETNTTTDIVSLAEELKRLRETTKDVVASTSAIKAVSVQVPESIDERRQRLEALPKPQIQGIARYPPKNELRLEVPDNSHGRQTFPLTQHGSLQLADKAGIPREYYEAMLNAGMTDLTAANVNAWLTKNSDRRLVRIADGKVRALLSDRYRILDNYDLAVLTMQRVKENNATIQQCSLTETRMYIKAVVPHFRESIKAGDDIVPGLVVSNSEVGDGAFRVEPFTFRLVCSNGTIGESKLYQVHLGKRMELGELIYKDDTRKAADEYLWKQVRDVIDSTFNRDVLRLIVDQQRKAMDLPLSEDPKKIQEVFDVTAKNLSISDKATNDLFRYFAREGGTTVFDMVNGITRLAQDFDEKYDERVRLERAAGKLLEAKVPIAH